MKATSPPLRILLITTSYPRFPGDAAGHFVAVEAQRFLELDADVTVLCPGPGTSAPPSMDVRGAAPRVVWIRDNGLFGWPGAIPRLREQPLRVLGLARFVWSAMSWVRKAGPFDAIVAHWTVPCGWPIALAASGPIEVVAHGSDVRVLMSIPGVARWVTRRLLARKARFRFVSHELEQALSGLVGPQLERVSRVEPAPIDLPPTPARAEARVRLGVPAEARLVLVVSRLVPGKRLRLALSAGSLVPDARVVVVGDGPLRSTLESRFPEVRFVGRLSRPDTLAWMAASDVLVTASIQEGAPTVVREARALGVPVVAAPAGDLVRWARSDPGLQVIASTGLNLEVRDGD